MKLIPYNDNNGNLANLTAFCTVNTITTAFIINAIDPLNITLIETVTLLDINKVGDA